MIIQIEALRRAVEQRVDRLERRAVLPYAALISASRTGNVAATRALLGYGGDRKAATALPGAYVQAAYVSRSRTNRARLIDEAVSLDPDVQFTYPRAIGTAIAATPGWISIGYHNRSCVIIDGNTLGFLRLLNHMRHQSPRDRRREIWMRDIEERGSYRSPDRYMIPPPFTLPGGFLDSADHTGQKRSTSTLPPQAYGTWDPRPLSEILEGLDFRKSSSPTPKGSRLPISLQELVGSAPSILDTEHSPPNIGYTFLPDMPSLDSFFPQGEDGAKDQGEDRSTPSIINLDFVGPMPPEE